MPRSVRLFFGNFLTDTRKYALIGAGGTQFDIDFPDFTMGINVTGNGVLHTRRPLGIAGLIQTWDEYLDLQVPYINTTRSSSVSVFKRFDEVEELEAWANSDFAYRSKPTNQITMEFNAKEMMFPTRRLSLPYPAAVLNPQAYWLPTSYALHLAEDLYYKVYITLWNAGLTLQSYPVEVDVFRVNASVVPHVIRIHNPNSFVCAYTIHLVSMTRDLFGKLQITDWPVNVVAHTQVGAIAADSFLDVSLVIEGAAVGVINPPLAALNDARARLHFDYSYNNRIDVTSKLFTQQVMLLDTERWKYYKGIIIACTDNIKNGYARSPDRMAQIVIQRTEEGYWVKDAWTAPNTVGNFRKEFPV